MPFASGRIVSSTGFENGHALWNDLYSAKLLEVMVERKSLFDTKSLDDNLAAAIRKAPVLIGKTLECLPRKNQVCLVILWISERPERKNPSPNSNARFLSPRALRRVNVSSIT